MKKGFDYTGVAVVFACHDGKGNFLFAKRGQHVRDGQGMWEMPAGGVKFGETVYESLLREIREELCIEPIETTFMNFKEVIQRNGEQIIKHWVNFEYLVLVNPENVKIGEPNKCDAIEWRKLDNVPEPLHFGVKETIASIIAYKTKT